MFLTFKIKNRILVQISVSALSSYMLWASCTDLLDFSFLIHKMETKWDIVRNCLAIGRAHKIVANTSINRKSNNFYIFTIY